MKIKFVSAARMWLPFLMSLLAVVAVASIVSAASASAPSSAASLQSQGVAQYDDGFDALPQD